MINIIMHGCGGKMGQVVAEIVGNDDACQIVAGIDPRLPAVNFPVFATPADCTVDADVIIDFSTATAVPALLEFSKAKNIPVVVCTTALSDETTELLKETAKSVAVFKSANMSVGINLLMELVQKAAQILYDANFDIEIVEKHHNQKIDAPSGTAMALADAINEAMDQQFHYVYDRSQTREKRERKEIGIHAVRGGNIVGDHDVIFAGRDEVIELRHQATSREVFAVGAVKAAKYMAFKDPGFYSMKDVLA
ncbi:MAG: 4-hydroxy-tetrahydrodipicolinate reductase [Anaerotignum sp.]|nr:4-hydroxy-tetrahydrodipicolinate reductase [Anaerotignum sp.]